MTIPAMSTEPAGDDDESAAGCHSCQAPLFDGFCVRCPARRMLSLDPFNEAAQQLCKASEVPHCHHCLTITTATTA